MGTSITLTSRSPRKSAGIQNSHSDGIVGRPNARVCAECVAKRYQRRRSIVARTTARRNRRLRRLRSRMRATSLRPSWNTAEPRSASDVVEALWLAAVAERDDERLRFKGPPARSFGNDSLYGNARTPYPWRPILRIGHWP